MLQRMISRRKEAIIAQTFVLCSRHITKLTLLSIIKYKSLTACHVSWFKNNDIICWSNSMDVKQGLNNSTKGKQRKNNHISQLQSIFYYLQFQQFFVFKAIITFYYMNNLESNRQGTPIYDTLETQSQRFNFGQNPAASIAAKEAMQQLYKNQLDSLMLDKQRQRQAEKTKQQEQRRQFNERAELGKEAEKMKEISYKNYYNMLMNNQIQNGESYISPFSKRDALKEELIDKNLEDERKKYQLIQIEQRKRQQEKKNSYRNQLLNQIQQRKRKQYIEKNELQRQKEYFQQTTKVPQEIKRYEKEKKKEQIEKYREDLEKGLVARENRSISQAESDSRINSQYHNTLTNPLPYNIQNPYILQQMGIPKNQSYLAMKGSQNLKLS